MKKPLSPVLVRVIMGVVGVLGLVIAHAITNAMTEKKPKPVPAWVRESSDQLYDQMRAKELAEQRAKMEKQLAEKRVTSQSTP